MYEGSFATIGAFLGCLEPCVGSSWRFKLSNDSFSHFQILYTEILSSILLQFYLLVNIKQVSSEKHQKIGIGSSLESPGVGKI